MHRMGIGVCNLSLSLAGQSLAATHTLHNICSMCIESVCLVVGITKLVGRFLAQALLPEPTDTSEA